MILASVLTQILAMMAVLLLMILVVTALTTLSSLNGVVITTQINLFLRKCAAPVAAVEYQFTASVHVLLMNLNAGRNVLTVLMPNLEMEKRKENKRVEKKRKKKSKMVGK